MNPYKFNVKFRLEKRADASGDFPINADITFNGKRIFFFTGCKLAESQWNADTQQMKRNNFNRAGISASDINNRLLKVRSAIEAVFQNLEARGVVATPKALRESIRKELDGEKVSRYTVGECYQKLIDEREAELKDRPATATWTLSTLKKHKTMLRHLSDFERTLYFEDLTTELLQKFEVYLVAKGLSNGYVAKSLVDIKTFLNWATERGYNTNNAYKGFTGKYKGDSGNSSLDDEFSLNKSELESVINAPIASAAIARTRDIFVFCCFTGLRFSDVIELRWSDFTEDSLVVVTEKTNHRIDLKLNQTTRGILAKYKGVCEDGHVFPKISNQKFNKNLKTLGQLAGLNGAWMKIRHVGNQVTKTAVPKYECLSSHAARRTFVSYALYLGFSPEIIRAITGHTTSRMMQNYVKFDDTTRQEFFDRLDGGGALSIQKKEKRITNVFDFAESDNDVLMIRRMLELPDKQKYLKQVERDPMEGVVHIAAFLWNMKSATEAAPYIDRLDGDYLEQFYDLLFKTKQYRLTR